MYKILAVLLISSLLSSCIPFQRSEEAVIIKVNTATKSFDRDISASVNVHSEERVFQ